MWRPAGVGVLLSLYSPGRRSRAVQVLVGWMSGLNHLPGKQVALRGAREFESRSYLHTHDPGRGPKGSRPGSTANIFLINRKDSYSGTKCFGHREVRPGQRPPARDRADVLRGDRRPDRGRPVLHLHLRAPRLRGPSSPLGLHRPQQSVFAPAGLQDGMPANAKVSRYCRRAIARPSLPVRRDAGSPRGRGRRLHRHRRAL